MFVTILAPVEFDQNAVRTLQAGYRLALAGTISRLHEDT
jgi:hypothetical protein